MAQVSERVREALAEAEKRAEHIVAEAQRSAHESISEAEVRARELVAEAEREANRIRAETEKEARERVERARAALDELGQALKPASTSAEPPAESERAAPEEAPAEATPEPVEDEPEPEREPEPEGAEPAADSSSTDELVAQLKGGSVESTGATEAGGGKGDAGAARLVAMNMALEGASREDVDKRLAAEFEVDDREALLDDVFSRVGK